MAIWHEVTYIHPKAFQIVRLEIQIMHTLAYQTSIPRIKNFRDILK